MAERKMRWIFLAAVIAVMTAGTALAKSDDDALGIRAGAFTVKPKLTIGTEYNDNIYATKNDKKSDWATVVNPKIDVTSNWSRHLLDLNAELKSAFYASESDEDYVDGRVFVNGRVDVRREAFIKARAGFERLHDERDDPDAAYAWQEPARYYRTTADIAYHQGLNRFSITAGADFSSLDYRSVALKGGGSEDLDIRDRNLYGVTARLAYELNPEVQPFVTARYEWRRYDREREALRDSKGYRIGVGTGFKLTGVTSSEIFAGVMNQDYADRGDNSGFWYGMSLFWEPTRMTSVKVTGQSSIMETTRADASSINAWDAGVSIDHELLRNLLVGAMVKYDRYDYKGEDITDNDLTLGPSLTYLWNRNLSAKAQYAYRTTDSNVSERDFTENRFSLSITGEF